MRSSDMGAVAEATGRRGMRELAEGLGVAGVVASLSSQFGEAQGFATHRVAEYHHWLTAEGGRVMRCFAYLGERGEVLADRGAVTEAERRLPFGGLAVASAPAGAGILGRVDGW